MLHYEQAGSVLTQAGLIDKECSLSYAKTPWLLLIYLICRTTGTKRWIQT